MEAEERLRSAVQRHAKEREQAVQRVSAVDRRRDEAIRAAAAAGLTRRRIAQIVGVSFQRVQQIVSEESVGAGR